MGKTGTSLRRRGLVGCVIVNLVIATILNLVKRDLVDKGKALSQIKSKFQIFRNVGQNEEQTNSSFLGNASSIVHSDNSSLPTESARLINHTVELQKIVNHSTPAFEDEKSKLFNVAAKHIILEYHETKVLTTEKALLQQDPGALQGVEQVEPHTSTTSPDQKLAESTRQNADRKADIALCVLTAHRTSNHSYLDLVLQSIEREIRSSPPTTFNLAVHIIDVSIDRDDRSDVLRARHAFPSFTFSRLRHKTWENCTQQMMDTDEGDGGRPPCSVRQQTRDVAATLNHCSSLVKSSHTGHSGWTILIEDDTDLCEGSLPNILWNLEYMSAHKPHAWRCIGFSTFYSGVAIVNSKIPRYTAHLMEVMDQKPVDHAIWDKWADGECVVYPGNLLSHKGTVSVFQYRNTKKFRDEWDGMRFSARQTDCVLVQRQDMQNMLSSMSQHY